MKKILFELDLMFDIKSIEEAEEKLEYYKTCYEELKEILDQ